MRPESMTLELRRIHGPTLCRRLYKTDRAGRASAQPNFCFLSTRLKRVSLSRLLSQDFRFRSRRWRLRLALVRWSAAPPATQRRGRRPRAPTQNVTRPWTAGVLAGISFSSHATLASWLSSHAGWKPAVRRCSTHPRIARSASPGPINSDAGGNGPRTWPNGQSGNGWRRYPKEEGCWCFRACP